MVLVNEQIDKYIYAFAIFIFFLIFRVIFRKTIIVLLEKITSRTKTDIDDKLLKTIKSPIDFLFVVIGIKLSVDYLSLEGDFATYLNNIIFSLFTLVLFWAIFNLVKPLADIISNKSSKINDKELGGDLLKIVVKSIQIIILALGFITILQEWGYNITAFLASLGLIGMAIALAAKDTVANLFGSLVIFSDKPFNIGDWIKTSQVEGIVEEVGVRSTKVRTFAQALVSVPNASLANDSILNWSRMGKRRIKTTLTLTYSTSTEQMENILSDIRQMLKEDKDIHQDAIYIYFTEFGSDALEVFCYFFTVTTNWAEFMRVRESVNLKMIKIIEKNGSSFAFPSRSIYIENDNEVIN